MTRPSDRWSSRPAATGGDICQPTPALPKQECDAARVRWLLMVSGQLIDSWGLEEGEPAVTGGEDAEDDDLEGPEEVPGHSPVILRVCRHHGGKGGGEAAEIALDEGSLHVPVVHLSDNPHQPGLCGQQRAIEANHQVSDGPLRVAGAGPRVNAVGDRAVSKEDTEGLGEDEGDKTGEGRDVDLEEEEAAKPSLLRESLRKKG
mmetsp:Transcript_8132/g.18574  ORF Transcript_8132/g.18574 Transcript_8132/m.18574 type:complete len:203 (+) Transcript_8132:80-688(+)|eukprot:745868-Hanusia_phi.AAC.4